MGNTDKRRSAVALGVAAETFVSAALRQDGWDILARNWRGGGGELDIIALSGGVLRVVEVKARTNADPLQAITPRKQRRLIQAAEAYLATTEVSWQEISFSIAMVEDGVLSWLHDAFDA
ncbi:MAG: YraN family protein [Myxococcota bacterium]|nr:YraN family protein [Myxococcota bacterium]